MAETGKRLAREPWEAKARFRPSVLLAEAELSPLEVARAKLAGRLQVEALPGGQAELLVGGVAIASGSLVMKGGAAWFKVGAMHESAGEGEEA